MKDKIKKGLNSGYIIKDNSVNQFWTFFFLLLHINDKAIEEN